MSKFRYLNVVVEYDKDEIFSSKGVTIRTYSSAAGGDKLPPTGEVTVGFRVLLGFVAKWAREQKLDQIRAMSDMDIVSRL